MIQYINSNMKLEDLLEKYEIKGIETVELKHIYSLLDSYDLDYITD